MAEVKSDYELYVERYAKDRGITPEEAKEHAIVKDVEKYYKEMSEYGK